MPKLSPRPFYLSPTTELSQEKPKAIHEVYQYIQKINDRNCQIKNIFVENVKITIKQQITVKVHGRLAMQKDKYFRLKVWHDVLGQEMDIGSNVQHFWFWSKRMDNPALYYAKHENLNKTMLKTPLNPSWLIESLNLGEIDVENIEVAKFKNFWAIIQPRISALEQNVTVVTLIDPIKIAVVGRYLYNSDGILTASTETRDFTTDSTGALIPKNLFIIWYDEGIIMNWELIAPKININIDKNYWLMPNMRKVDIGK